MSSKSLAFRIIWICSGLAGMKDARVLFFAVLAAFFVSTIILIQIAAWLRCWFGTSSASSGDNTPSPRDSDSP
jgi:hypothetical protein